MIHCIDCSCNLKHTVWVKLPQEDSQAKLWREFHGKLYAPPLSSLAFDQATMWYCVDCVDWWNA